MATATRTTATTMMTTTMTTAMKTVTTAMIMTTTAAAPFVAPAVGWLLHCIIAARCTLSCDRQRSRRRRLSPPLPLQSLVGTCIVIRRLISSSPANLGCAFRRNSGRFRQNSDTRHRPFRFWTGTGTGMCYNTNFDIPVYSGWYLYTRFLQVENARNYSK